MTHDDAALPPDDDRWIVHEGGFPASHDTRLFYRHWAPRRPRADGPPRALVLLHRGHEHSGRVAALVRDLGFAGDHAFAWDARGHGHSPGERGEAPDFAALVEDLDAFVRHIQRAHGIAVEDMVVVANSVGAVIAATWMHDHAPAIRGVVMAAAAFAIKLYIPLAIPALKLGLGFKPGLQVTSYIRPGMLTHSADEARAYADDPLNAKQVSGRVLVDMAATARRIVGDAAAIDTPVLMLAADQDHVVKTAPQREFFERLSSPSKRFVQLRDCRHAIFYESEPVRAEAIAHCRAFIDACWAQAPAPAERFRRADVGSRSAQAYQRLVDGKLVGAPTRAFHAFQRAMLGTLGGLSQGMRIGMTQGFDSGASLDYVYRNQAQGRLGIGAFIDRGYLDAIGWRGIRLRRKHLRQTVSRLIAERPGDAPVRILDIAAGGGRYLLETLKCHRDRRLHVTLRDRDPANLEMALALAREMGLGDDVAIEARDAFDPASYAGGDAQFDIVIASGLYELFADNAPVLCSLEGVARQLKPGGVLVYTGQPWHPQLALIAGTLRNHRGEPWLMRPRPQAELDGLVACAGLAKTGSLIGLEGIFTVSVARRPPAAG
ncbi:bifunctional alpha/beta hydrolase/class I SAM-dependent methyltransferase [Scleromatobacter humisilvae]|uniref:Bifunctional alpha/beta hydrolase/class I SAM-dependent methyltransferase n=1 Tax=Scleromatobacter humisilvae TaxID=2897159 RepID=A0A9X1YHZ7_9BURK|nr:bifunctional alpha/beta hydrolase/class I SAM-dependent methyltransferase [Scleromatobacter humisilvae]MCK9686261.1 bifunctional alpha/beta hydrolase/class I SAM-dependent methyltransferase [Scleromatobacter humisilvae]